LCAGYPEEMTILMNYCRQLKFEEAPNYVYLKRLFRELYGKCGFEHEFIFDWTIQRYRVDKPSQNNGAEEESKANNHLGAKTSTM
jgi:hypothetical protein